MTKFCLSHVLISGLLCYGIFSGWCLRICTARFPLCFARYEHHAHWWRGSFPPHSTNWCLFNVLFQRYCFPQSGQLYNLAEACPLLCSFVKIFIEIICSQGCHLLVGVDQVVEAVKKIYVSEKVIFITRCFHDIILISPYIITRQYFHDYCWFLSTLFYYSLRNKIYLLLNHMLNSRCSDWNQN